MQRLKCSSYSLRHDIILTQLYSKCLQLQQPKINQQFFNFFFFVVFQCFFFRILCFLFILIFFFSKWKKKIINKNRLLNTSFKCDSIIIDRWYTKRKHKKQLFKTWTRKFHTLFLQQQQPWTQVQVEQVSHIKNKYSYKFIM